MRPMKLNWTSVSHRRCGGSVYVAALGAAMLMTVIGLAAMAVARAEVRTLQMQQDMLAARRLAESGIDVALHIIDQDPNWRNTYTHDIFVADENFHGGTFKWKLADEEDNDLADDDTEPVRIIAWGSQGRATQKVSVMYAPGGELGVNIIDNPGFENGTTSWVSIGASLLLDLVGPLTGSSNALIQLRISSSSGLQQDMTSQIENDTLYDVELWARTNSGTTDIQVSFIIDSTGEGTRTINHGNATTVDTNWTKVTATIDPSWTGVLNSAKFRVHTVSGVKTFHVDDVEVVKTITRQGPMMVVEETWRREVDASP